MSDNENISFNGALVISLDFEMFWGMADVANIAEMTPTMQKVHDVVPRLILLFKKYGIHATWATVGALMASDREEFLKYLPSQLPTQTKVTLEKAGLIPENDEEKCPRSILFAPELVMAISGANGQEIATHTYSHYYCSNKDSNPSEFAAEIDAALKLAKEKNLQIDSAVFPRNQVADSFLTAMGRVKRLSFRGNERGFISQLRVRHPKIGTLLWYIDNYIPLQRRTSYKLEEIFDEGIFNIRNSRFFKPFRPKYRFAERLKLYRYKREMLKAAKKGEIYHMYWHPHNFAVDTEVNFAQMEELLAFYADVCKRHGMRSLNMREVATEYCRRYGVE